MAAMGYRQPLRPPQSRKRAISNRHHRSPPAHSTRQERACPPPLCVWVSTPESSRISLRGLVLIACAGFNAFKASLSLC